MARARISRGGLISGFAAFREGTESVLPQKDLQRLVLGDASEAAVLGLDSDYRKQFRDNPIRAIDKRYKYQNTATFFFKPSIPRVNLNHSLTPSYFTILYFLDLWWRNF